MKDKINTDSQQKTALADGFTSSLTRFVNNTELDPKNTSILTNYVNFVKSEDSVDPTGIEPVRPIFLGSAPKPGGPTLFPLLQILPENVNVGGLIMFRRFMGFFAKSNVHEQKDNQKKCSSDLCIGTNIQKIIHSVSSISSIF